MDGMGRRRVRLRISGLVQGVGFRPFVWRRAARHGLSGWVENDPGGVTVEAEGDDHAIASFLDGFAAAAPPLSRVAAVDCRDLPCAEAPAGFVIRESTASRSRFTAVVPADIAPCSACLAEMSDPRNRRFGHPFISCTDCGPRFTIIDALPYDRAATSMQAFPMCPACAAEYRDPASRRFHAQPIACPECGPAVWFGRSVAPPLPLHREAATTLGAAAIEAARAMLHAGGIVAIKGVGGFHLACDATSPSAVRTLRERKGRLRKPFALMVADAAAAQRIARVDDQERRLLEGPERPIVLLRRGLGHDRGADAIAPGNDFIGVMLPSSPLHHLLCSGMPPLVMTSGNLAEEPIATENEEAAARLGRIADGFVFHDRDIRIACDDSVARCVVGFPLPIRRSRGHTPLPVRLPVERPAVLAVGGELKAAVCVARGAEAVLGQHVGDMASWETLEWLDRTAHHLLTLLDVKPAAVVADLHPGYLSTRWAREFGAARGIPVVQVPHHEAHVAALLAEHGLDLATADGVIGVCFDGTGYGRDGTIQGGEVFTCRDGGLLRAAHLLPFPLPGGDAAIRHPWRTALAVLQAAALARDPGLPCIAAATPAEIAVLERQLAGGLGCHSTTSMGRLFDAVASIIGVRHEIDYEAEAALNLEALASRAADPRPHAGRVAAGDDGMLTLDWRPIVAGIVGDVLAGRPRESLAAGFHDAVAGLVVETCVRLRGRGCAGPVGLTGGVFQNALLVERTLLALHREGFDVLLHHAVPPNDAGLALGQAVLARAAVTEPRG